MALLLLHVKSNIKPICCALFRQAQINIARRRAGIKTPVPGTGIGTGEAGGRPKTSGTWEVTPGMTQVGMCIWV